MTSSRCLLHSSIRNKWIFFRFVKCQKQNRYNYQGVKNFTSWLVLIAKFSREVHARCMWDDFLNLTSHPSSVTKCPLHQTKVLTQGAHEMTFQTSPCIYLAWPSVPSTTLKFSCKVHSRWLFKSHLASIYLAWPSVPSTTPKFSCEVHMRWLFKSHLVSI